MEYKFLGFILYITAVMIVARIIMVCGTLIIEIFKYVKRKYFADKKEKKI